MAHYGDSSAYDFSLFEPQADINKNHSGERNIYKTKKTYAKEQKAYYYDGNAVRKPKAEPEIKTEPERKTEPARKKARKEEVVYGEFQHSVKRESKAVQVSPYLKRAIVYGAIVVSLIFSLLVMNSKNDKIAVEISDIDTKIAVADGEIVKLNSEISSRFSAEKVEKYAENVLGMVKAENYQISYLDLSDGDKVVVSGDKKVKEKKTILQKVKDVFAYISEK